MYLAAVAYTLAFAGAVVAQRVGVPSVLGVTCWFSAADYDFGCGARISFKEFGQAPCLCRNDNFLGTALKCANNYAHSEQSTAGATEFFREYCLHTGYKEYEIEELGKLFSRFEESNSFIEVNGSDPKELHQGPILVPRERFAANSESITAQSTQYRLASIYGSVLLAFWGVVCGLAMAHNILQTCMPYIHRNKAFAGLRRYVTLPALYKGKHNAPLRLFGRIEITAPTRGQSFVVVAYVLLNVIFLAVGYSTHSWDPIQHKPRQQIFHYLGSRAGIIAFTQLPVIVLFAARNNPLITLTGWSYSTFQVYHHWVARVMVLNATIHAVVLYVLMAELDALVFRWEDVHNWRFGNVALFASLVIAITAQPTFRARAYEWFRAIHKVAFWLFVVMLAMHCYDFGWMPWLYATIALYVSEMLIRFYRWWYAGGIVKAQFQLTDDKTHYRVSIDHNNRWRHPPQSYLRIRVLTTNLFWQSHPFSLFTSPLPEEAHKLQLICKIKNGSTKTIAQFLEKQPEGRATLPVMVEGPYGHAAPLTDYDTVMLVAGGIGVTAMYSYATALIEACRPNQKVVFAWVIQTADALHWFHDELNFLLKHSDKVELRVFVSRGLFHGQSADVHEKRQSIEPSRLSKPLKSVRGSQPVHPGALSRTTSATETIRPGYNNTHEPADPVTCPSPALLPPRGSSLVPTDSVYAPPHGVKLPSRYEYEATNNRQSLSDTDLREVSFGGHIYLEENHADHHVLEAPPRGSSLRRSWHETFKPRSSSLREVGHSVHQILRNRLSVIHSQDEGMDQESSTYDFEIDMTKLDDGHEVDELFEVEVADEDPIEEQRHIDEVQRRFGDHVRQWRPNIRDEVSELIATAKSGSVAICSCGPPVFVDHTRAAIVDNIQATDKRIEYIEEAFAF